MQDHNGRRRRTLARIMFSLLAICGLGFMAEGQEPNAATAKVEGTVFVRDSAGTQSFVPGAKVNFTGAATLETETNQNGEFAVADVPLGTYTVEVSSPGLAALETVSIESGVVHISLELKPTAVATSVVVTPDSTEPTISASS